MDAELEKRIRQIVDDASLKYIGVNIDRLSEDLSQKVMRQRIDEGLFQSRYRDAKKAFRKAFITRLLVLHLGNISEAARILDIDRRTMHRVIADLRIDVKEIKEQLAKPYYVRVGEVTAGIENALEKYRGILHPGKFESFYRNASHISETIVEILPASHSSLKEAEESFEKAYLTYALRNNPSIGAAARKIGLRHETLLRKAKMLGLR
jgi:DNA-binding NtrC family response regulator